jgi:hypothetical protein
MKSDVRGRNVRRRRDQEREESDPTAKLWWKATP